MDFPQSDTSRVKATEADKPWPAILRIVAVWPSGAYSGVTIDRDAFYGVGSGAPTSGTALVGDIDRLVRGGDPGSK